jgi:cytoskeletal protein CcmA (bactofilin family)
MSEGTVIGAGTRIRGRIHGEGDLTVDGFVEGDVKVNGEVQIGSTGLVASNVEGARITVRGAVRGDLTATLAIHLEEGARVVGAVRAPRVSVAAGTLYRGVLHTAAPGEALPPIAGQAQTAKPQAAPARPAAPAVAAKAPVAPAPVAARPAPPAVTAVAAPVPPPPSTPAVDDSEGDAETENDGTMPALRRGARGQVAKKKG